MGRVVGDPAALRVRDLAVMAHIAGKLLRQGGVTGPPVPENLVALCDPGRRVLVEERPLARGQHGVVQRDSLGWLIIVDQRAPRVVQRYTLFHEGFLIIRRARGLALAGDGLHYLEWLANAFANRVLMPREWVYEALRTTTDLRRLCEMFYVSRPRSRSDCGSWGNDASGDLRPCVHGGAGERLLNRCSTARQQGILPTAQLASRS